MTPERLAKLLRVIKTLTPGEAPAFTAQLKKQGEYTADIAAAIQEKIND